MSKRKLIIAVAFIGAAAVFLWTQHSINEKLRSDNDALRTTIAELRRLQKPREPVAANESLTREQMDELLRLRGEVTRLRAQTDQIGALTEANQKLLASLKELETLPKLTVSKKKGAEDALPQDIHPRDSWSFRGYATPEATLESFFWGEVNGNKAAMLGAFSPELQTKFEKEHEGEDIVKRGEQIKSTGFRIADRRQLSENEIVLTFYTDRQSADGHIFYNDFSPTVFERVGGQWKMTDRHAPDD